MLPAQPFVLRVMSGLALATAIDHSSTATTLFKRHFAGRLIQLAELAGGVGASNELPGQLQLHPIIRIQRQSRYCQALTKAVPKKEEKEGAVTNLCSIRTLKDTQDQKPQAHELQIPTCRVVADFSRFFRRFEPRYEVQHHRGKAVRRWGDAEAVLDECGQVHARPTVQPSAPI